MGFSMTADDIITKAEAMLVRVVDIAATQFAKGIAAAIVEHHERERERLAERIEGAKAIAAEAGIDRATLWRLAKAGNFPLEHRRGRVSVTRRALEHWRGQWETKRDPDDASP